MKAEKLNAWFEGFVQLSQYVDSFKISSIDLFLFQESKTRVK
jgi:hypothetical protein